MFTRVLLATDGSPNTEGGCVFEVLCDLIICEQTGFCSDVYCWSGQQVMRTENAFSLANVNLDDLRILKCAGLLSGNRSDTASTGTCRQSHRLRLQGKS